MLTLLWSSRFWCSVNGEPSPLGGSTGPGWKAACFDFWRAFFFQNKTRHLSSRTSTATKRMMAPHSHLFAFLFFVSGTTNKPIWIFIVGDRSRDVIGCRHRHRRRYRRIKEVLKTCFKLVSAPSAPLSASVRRKQTGLRTWSIFRQIIGVGIGSVPRPKQTIERKMKFILALGSHRQQLLKWIQFNVCVSTAV